MMRLTGLALVACLLAACGNPGTGVAVVDLVAVARATGQDAELNRQAEAARLELEAQLGQIASDLEQQLKAEEARRGGAAAAAREQDFQLLAAQARTQLAQTQALAQQKAQAFQLGLASQYRQAVTPVATRIARDQGAGVLLVLDPTVLWFDSALDVTDEVIAELRESPLVLPGAAAPSEPADAPEAPDASRGQAVPDPEQPDNGS